MTGPAVHSGKSGWLTPGKSLTIGSCPDLLKDWRLVLDAEPPGPPGNGLSDSFEPSGDRPPDLAGTVFLREVETCDDDAVLVGEAARHPPDPARDEYAGLRVDEELRQRCCCQPCGVGGDPVVDVGRLARQRHLARPLQGRAAVVTGLQERSPVLC